MAERPLFRARDPRDAPEGPDECARGGAATAAALASRKALDAPEELLQRSQLLADPPLHPLEQDVESRAGRLVGPLEILQSELLDLETVSPSECSPEIICTHQRADSSNRR